MSSCLGGRSQQHNASVKVDKVKEVTLLSLIKRVNNTQRMYWGSGPCEHLEITIRLYIWCNKECADVLAVLFNFKVVRFYKLVQNDEKMTLI